MTIIVGIRFKDSGKIYYFDPGDIEISQGDIVIVDTARGPEMAKVVFGRSDVAEDAIVGELKPILRHAEPADFDRLQSLQTRHDEVMARCAEKIKEHSLPMGLVKAEYNFDGSRLTFYFTAEQRVDFRMLVRDLARTFRSRIELRQIGPRDEARLLGGIGPCGRPLCCTTFLPDYARVSIKMAKDQDLPLNPSKISGVCGRLLCCLSYEHQQYLGMKAEMPGKGTWVQTPDGPGDVISVNVLRSTVTVRLASSGMQEEYTTAQVQQATAGVQAVARGRTNAGVTPAAQFAPIDDSDERELLQLLDDEPEELQSFAVGAGYTPASPSDSASRADSDSSVSESSSGERKRKRPRRRRKPPAPEGESAQTAPATAQAAQERPPPASPAEGEGETRSRPSRSRRRRKKTPSESE